MAVAIMDKKFSFGVGVFGIFALIFGLYDLCWVLSLGRNLFVIIQHFLLGVCLLITGFGLLRLKNWARITYIFMALLRIGFSVYYLYAAKRYPYDSFLAAVFIELLVPPSRIIFVFSLWYLTCPNVKEQFR